MNRTLRSIKFRAIGAGVLIVISVMIYVGFMGMIPIASMALEDKVDELNLADYMVHVGSGNESEAAELKALPGVGKVESRLQISSRMDYTKEGKSFEVTVFLYGIDPARRPGIDTPELIGTDSSYFDGSGGGSALVEKSFAERAAIGTGDTVAIHGGTGNVELKVTGVVLAPEYLFEPINPSSLMPYPGSLAVVYVPIDWLRTAFGMPDGTVNEFMFMFENGPDGAGVRKAIDDRLSRDVIIYSIPKDDVYSYALIKEDLSSGEEFVGLFALLFLAVAFFIVYISFVRIVEEQRREIGVLMALGYPRGRILASYVYMAALIGGSSSLIGVLLGMPLGQSMGAFYTEMMMGQALMAFMFTPQQYLIGFLFGPLTAGLACIGAVWGTVRMQPQDAIRGTPRAFLGSASARGNGHRKGEGSFSYITRYTLRNMARHKVRTTVVVLAIGAAMMMGGMTVLMESFYNAIDKSIEDYEKWDVLAEFSYPLNGSQVEGLKGPDTLEVVPISKFSVRWADGGRDGLALTIGLTHGQTLHMFNVVEGTRAASGSEVMLNKGFAEDNGIRKGDRLTLSSFTGSENVTVTALVQDYTAQVYADQDVADVLTGGQSYAGMYIRTPEGRAGAVAESLLASPLVSDAQTKGNAKGALVEFMTSFADLMYIMLLIGVAIAAPTLANMVFITVLERYPEYGQLRAIGYSRGQVARSILIELNIMMLAGSIIGLPFTYLFVKGYEGSFKEFFPSYTTVLYPADWSSYILTVAVIYLIALLAALPSIRYVNRMDIATTVAGGRFG